MGVFFRFIFSILAFFSVFSLFIKILFVKLMKFFLRKGYAEVSAIMTKRLAENPDFIDFALEKVKGVKKVNYEVSLIIFFSFPEVETMAKEEVANRQEAFRAKNDVSMLIWEDIVETLADEFSKGWKRSDTTNALVLKVKSKIN